MNFKDFLKTKTPIGVEVVGLNPSNMTIINLKKNKNMNTSDKFEDLKRVFNKYVLHTNNIDVIEDILKDECNEKMLDYFVTESGRFLTDSFTFLKEMGNVPQMYRERLFNSFYGSKKTELTHKWFKVLKYYDNTYEKHLTSHVLCLLRGFINEQKRKYNVENVKSLPV